MDQPLVNPDIMSKRKPSQEDYDSILEGIKRRQKEEAEIRRGYLKELYEMQEMDRMQKEQFNMCPRGSPAFEALMEHLKEISKGDHIPRFKCAKYIDEELEELKQQRAHGQST